MEGVFPSCVSARYTLLLKYERDDNSGGQTAVREAVRKEPHMKGIPLILLAVFLGAIGQIVLKRGMQLYGEVSAAGVWGQLIPILTTPQVAIGFLCYGLSSALWIAVVSNTDLSLAYPMISAGYVIVFVASWLFLGEHISPLRLTGLLIIVAGVVIISRS
jgi:drug/metabolite transporter (DMT)-like permease